MFAVLMSTLLLATADPGSSSSPSAAKSIAPPAAAQAHQKPRALDVTCWDEKPTGSHMTQTICATREQLEKAQRDALDVTNIRLHPAAGMGH